MPRLCILLATFIALVPVTAAQPVADSALVARIYDDLARGDVAAVVAVLDDHVLWIDSARSRHVERHFGRGTVAAYVLEPQVAARTADVPDAITPGRGRVVSVGTTRRMDPVTGQATLARFHDVWRVIDGRVVSVERSASQPMDAQAAEHHGPDC